MQTSVYVAGSKPRNAKRPREECPLRVHRNVLSSLFVSRCPGIITTIRSFLGVHANCAYGVLGLYRQLFDCCCEASYCFFGAARINRLYVTDNDMDMLLAALRRVVATTLLDTEPMRCVANAPFRDWVAIVDCNVDRVLQDDFAVMRLFADLRLCIFPPISGFFCTSFCTVFQTLGRARILMTLRAVLSWCRFLHDFLDRHQIFTRQRLSLKSSARQCLLHSFPYAY